MGNFKLYTLALLASAMFIGCAQNSSDVGRGGKPLPTQGKLADYEEKVVLGWQSESIMQVTADLISLAQIRLWTVAEEAKLIDNQFTIRCSQNGCQSERKTK